MLLNKDLESKEVEAVEELTEAEMMQIAGGRKA